MEKMAVTVTWKRWLSSVGPHYEYLDAVEQVEVMFEQAAAACAAGRCRFFEALAIERLARFFLREEPNAMKRSQYLTRAATLYRSWGAVTKAAALEKQMVRT